MSTTLTAKRENLLRSHLNLDDGDYADDIEFAKLEKAIRVTYREYSAFGNMKLIAVQKAVINTMSHTAGCPHQTILSNVKRQLTSITV